MYQWRMEEEKRHDGERILMAKSNGGIWIKPPADLPRRGRQWLDGTRLTRLECALPACRANITCLHACPVCRRRQPMGALHVRAEQGVEKSVTRRNDDARR